MSRKHEWRVVCVRPEEMENPIAVETAFSYRIKDIRYQECDGVGTLHVSIDRDEPFDPLSSVLRAYRDGALIGHFASVHCDRSDRYRITAFEVPECWERTGLVPDTMSHE